MNNTEIPTPKERELTHRHYRISEKLLRAAITGDTETILRYANTPVVSYSPKVGYNYNSNSAMAAGYSSYDDDHYTDHGMEKLVGGDYDY